MDSAFRCLRPASTGLIAASGLSVAVITFYTAVPAGILAGVQWKAVLLAVLLLVVTRVIPQTKKLHPVIWIALSALLGIVFSFAGA